jgi:carbon storage regulator
MLVLSRKVGERIVVPHCGLSVTVVAIKGKAVRLAFSAPPEVGIYREEISRTPRDRTSRPAATG